MLRRPHGLRTSLLLLVVISILPISGLIIYSGAQLRQYAMDDVEEDTLRSIQLGIMHYEELIDSAEQLLITLSQLPHIQSTDQRNCSALLSNLQPDFPQYSEISIVTVDGTPLCSTEEEANTARYAQHPWFTRAISSGEFTIGDFDINRQTGKAVLVFAYPLKDLEGKIHKLITASIDLAWLNNLASDAHLPSGSSVIMIDKNGTILAHYPNSEQWIGQALPDIVMLNNMLTTAVDTEVSDKLDGVRRFYAYQRIFNRTGAIEAVIGIGVPMTYVVNPVNQIINRVLIGCIIALITSLIAVWFGGDLLLVRQMKALLAATRRLAAGELTARTGLTYRRDEIGELARGFDDMASSLENQKNLFALAIQELRQSEEKFRTLAETSSAAISIYQNDRFIYVNSALSEITGYSQKELLGTSVWHMIAPEFDERYQQAYQERQDEQDTTTRFELKLLTRNGTERWIDYSSAVIDHNGEPALLSTGFDITQRIITEQAVEHTLDEILVLYEVAKAAFDAINTEELISNTSQIIGERLFPQTFGIVLVDRKNGMLRFHPSYHTPTAGRQDPMPLVDGIISHVVSTGEAYYSANVEKDPYYYCGEPLTRSEICVPIWVAGEVYGAINAESSLPNAFSKEDLVLLNAIANQVGTAIQKIQLYEAERRRREEAETLREASEMLTSSLELPEVLDSILEQLERVIPYDSTSVMLLDSGQPKVYASRGSHIVREDPFYTRLKTSDHIQKILEHGVPVRIANTNESASWVKRSEQSLARSWMGIPLVVKDEIIGLINLDKNEPDFYTDEDTQLALAFANQAASAIGNARLFSMERAHAYELEVIANISNSVRDEQNRSAILSILIDQVMSATKAAGAIVATGSDHSRSGIFEQGRGIWEPLSGQESPALTRTIVQYSPQTSSSDDGRSLRVPPEPLNQGMEVVGIPLLAQKHVVGMVFMGRKTPFSDSEIHLVQSISDIAASAIHRVTLFEQTELNVRRLSTLRTIDMAITASINVRLTLDILIEEAMANLKLEATDILLLNSATRSLDWAAGQGFHHVGLSRFKTTLPDPFSLENRTPVARAIYDRRPIFVEEIREIDSVRGPILAKEGFVSAYIVPFTVKGQVKGVMEIFSRSQILAEADWLGFLEALAGQAAIAIDNAELFNHLERSNQELSLAYDATIEGWSRALDLRDQETEGHSQRVTDLSMRLARVIGLRNETLVHIRRGALLHDIGKMGIPDEILLKPGVLDENEWQIMRQHPMLAYQLLSSISFLQPALDIPYCHHEKWDGSGYPRGLSEHEIPLAARIFAIVDVWDALRSDRPYRQAWSREEAIDYLRSQSGKHFDPAILTLFLTLIEGEENNQD